MAVGDGAGSGELAVGLVGAGPWASMLHAPAFAAHPRTRLAGVWARRREAAVALASRHGGVAFDGFEDLLAACDVVAFAVPPHVQADLAVPAARAGRALLLEKPLALDVPAAERVVEAVEASGVATRMHLTWRYSEAVRSFLSTVAASTPIGGRGHFLAGGLLEGPFATPWRLEAGPLADLGPHVLDLLDAALGEVVGIRAHGDPRRWIGLLLEHGTGVTSEVSLTAQSDLQPFRAGVEVYTRRGAIDFDAAAVAAPEATARAIDELLGLVEPHGSTPLDARRGLHLQRLLDWAARSMSASERDGATRKADRT